MNCEIHNTPMLDGTYVCSTEDYRILDTEGNLVYIYKEHDIEDTNDPEIGTSCPVKYCSPLVLLHKTTTCPLVWEEE